MKIIVLLTLAVVTTIVDAIAIRARAAPYSPRQVEATEWTTCPDFPNLECRNVTVPRFYEPVPVVQGNANGTLGVLERRLVSGQPKRHVWLLQGGPSTDSDVLAVNIPLFVNALGTDLVIQIPYQRGSPGTETIPEYPGYPANLEQYLSNQTIPIQAFNTLNIARDVIASIKGEQTRDPSVAHYAVGFSYGSQLLNQILLLEPALFKTAIFDGSMPPIGEGKSLLRKQGLFLSDLARAIADDCAQSADCRSLALNDLIAFVDGLSANISTPCFDQVVQAFGGSGAKDQVFYEITQLLAFQPNFPVPTAIFRNETVDVAALVPTVLNWLKGSRDDPNLIDWDNRVLLWAVINHFAQCGSASSDSFQKLLVQVYRPLAQFTQELSRILSDIGGMSTIITDHILFLELDDPDWTAENQRAAQAHTLLRRPDALLEYFDAARAAHAPYVNETPAALTAASDIQGDVVVVNGALDPNTPIDMARSFFYDLDVADGFDKQFIRFDNAGHLVTLGLWNSCSPLLLKAFIGGDEADKGRFSDCLETENNKPLDWALADFKAKTGFDIWEGLTKS